MLTYRWKVRALRKWRITWLWRKWTTMRGDEVGTRAELPALIAAYAPRRSFVDVGCMWGINGENAFVAEEAGATRVKGVDVVGPTPEFLRKMEARASSVEFILGDLIDRATIARVGVCDVVLCAGVLYHHPSPFDVLVALRRICGQTLILRTEAIPEVDGIPNAAIYWPMLSENERRLWAGPGRVQVGLSTRFRPEDGYGNWFWGLTPSCISALLQTAGFEVERRFSEPFAQTFVCAPVEEPFAHRLPADEFAALRLGRDVSDELQRTTGSRELKVG